MNELHVQVCTGVALGMLLEDRWDVHAYERTTASATPEERAEALRRLAKVLRYHARTVERAAGDLAPFQMQAGDDRA